MTIRFSVLTVSDRCAAGEAEDTSGPAVRRLVESSFDAQCVAADTLPDDQVRIERWLRDACDAEQPPDLILTTGGTGLASRDVTPEATRPVLHREHPGITELMRLRCLDRTPLAFLSRAVAGTRERTLIVNLPGSPRGAKESLEAIADILPHAIAVLRDDDVSEAHSSRQP